MPDTVPGEVSACMVGRGGARGTAGMCHESIGCHGSLMFISLLALAFTEVARGVQSTTATTNTAGMAWVPTRPDHSWRGSDVLHSAVLTVYSPPGGGLGGCGAPGRLPPSEMPRSPFPRSGALDSRPAPMPVGSAVQLAVYLVTAGGCERPRRWSLLSGGALCELAKPPAAA